MSFSFGTTLRVQIFGQSHAPSIGCVVEGLPAGIHVDMEALQRFMERRAPGRTPWSTPRKEADVPHVLCGLNAQGNTCGAPVAMVIENTNTRSKDYDRLQRVPRPGHADYSAWAKWGADHDVRGGGFFSARLTAPLCMAGGIALQILESRGVCIAAHVAQVGTVQDEPFDALNNSIEAQRHLSEQMAVLRALPSDAFPTLNADAGSQMIELIDTTRRALDSIGGVVECVATGMPAGVGGPRYDGLQGAVAHVVFGIPAVKGLEFGEGFGVAELCGSQNNDPYEMREGQPVPSTNHAGGSLGGITTGAPVLFRMAVKPTPSICAPQASVDLSSLDATTLEVHGRHDPCVAARAVPIAEAAMALALLDSWLSHPSGKTPR